MPKKIVIVGGGTAGWMSAAYLRVAFGDKVSVTVVESARVGTIGVGEATFSTVRHFFSFLGLEEDEWMPACNATYKLATRFEDWREKGKHFYHPFERPRVVDGFSLVDWWLHEPRSANFDQDCFVVSTLCEAKKSPRYLTGSLFEQDFIEAGEQPVYRTTMADQGTQFPYAYHFDAALLAKFLQGYGVRRGVRHVVDDVLDVRLDQRGWIDRVVTAEHGELDGDLFIDCTGFRGLLLNKALGVPFESYQDTLPNDSAVALRVPLNMAAEGVAPYVNAKAMDAGWIWTIPLFGRIGTGYVYASDYCDKDEAERTLRDNTGPAAEDLEAIHIKMRIGRSRDSWVNNCVAIGLSSGFVEPLESTGIFFIQNAIEQLVKHFPADDWDPRLSAAYNRQVAGVMDGVREFLVLHYHGSSRLDNDYWRDTKKRPVPDELATRIEEWQVRLPVHDNVFPRFHGFEPYSYVCVLLGQGRLPVRAANALGMFDATAAAKEFQLVADQAKELTRRLPGHYEYLAQLH